MEMINTRRFYTNKAYFQKDHEFCNWKFKKYRQRRIWQCQIKNKKQREIEEGIKTDNKNKENIQR